VPKRLISRISIKREKGATKGRQKSFPATRQGYKKYPGCTVAAVYKPAWRGLPQGFKDKPLVSMENK
jgi:hypothetical protein